MTTRLRPLAEWVHRTSVEAALAGGMLLLGGLLPIAPLSFSKVAGSALLLLAE